MSTLGSGRTPMAPSEMVTRDNRPLHLLDSALGGGLGPVRRKASVAADSSASNTTLRIAILPVVAASGP